MQSSRATPRPRALDWTPQSHLPVFVRNLQLLHLDQRDDWPGITVRSLSPTSQTQQRQRIKAVEWALYQLVTIWDPETARDVCYKAIDLCARIVGTDRAPETSSLLSAVGTAPVGQSARGAIPGAVRIEEEWRPRPRDNPTEINA